MANVLLLRTPSNEAPDKWAPAFEGRGYKALSVPVLDTVLMHLTELEHIVELGPGSYDGVIVTSARSCEAWKEVLQWLLNKTSLGKEPANWSTTPFYVVGEATAEALANIREEFGSSLAPRDIRGAAEAGTSERLGRFILDDLSGTDGSRRLLYLTGDKNRDTLPKILNEGDVDLIALQVYGTQGSPSFEGDLEDAMALLSSSGFSRWWIVFYAPSTAEFVMPILRKWFDLCQRDTDRVQEVSTKARIAAIGPTTATFLQNGLHLQVDAIAAKPTPDDLLNCIIAFDQSNP